MSLALHLVEPTQRPRGWLRGQRLPGRRLAGDGVGLLVEAGTNSPRDANRLERVANDVTEEFRILSTGLLSALVRSMVVPVVDCGRFENEASFTTDAELTVPLASTAKLLRRSGRCRHLC